jgi:hypothetical protein
VILIELPPKEAEEISCSKVETLNFKELIPLGNDEDIVIILLNIFL